MDFSSSLLRFPEAFIGLRLTSTLQPRKQGKCSQTLLQNLSLGGSGQFRSPLRAPAQYNTKCTTSHPNTPIKLLTPLNQSILFKKRVRKAWLASSFMDLNLWVCKSLTCAIAAHRILRSTGKWMEDKKMSNPTLKVNYKRSNCILFESPSNEVLKCNREIKAN